MSSSRTITADKIRSRVLQKGFIPSIAWYVKEERNFLSDTRTIIIYIAGNDGNWRFVDESVRIIPGFNKGLSLTINKLGDTISVKYNRSNVTRAPDFLDIQYAIEHRVTGRQGSDRFKAWGAIRRYLRRYLRSKGRKYSMSTEQEQTVLPFLDSGVNMLSQDQIDEIKKKYPNNDIYAVPIGGQSWVFRDIRRDEYYQIRNSNPEGTPEDFETMIVKRCILYPENFDFEKGKAGVPAVLSDLIFLTSGFEPTAPPVKL